VFLYACILLGNRHLPFLDPTLIAMKEGSAIHRLLFHFAASNCRPHETTKPQAQLEKHRGSAWTNRLWEKKEVRP
jgi:hypothetical protein